MCDEMHEVEICTTMPGSSRTHWDKQFQTPKKRIRQNYTIRNIEDEECPDGLMDTINTPGRTTAWHANIVDNFHDQIKGGSNGLSGMGQNDTPMLSLVAHYDEVMRKVQEYFEEDLTDEFLAFAERQEACRIEWLKSVQECRRLQSELDKANHEIGDYMTKLSHARKLLDQEKKARRRAEDERNNLEQQMLLARDLLFSSRIPEDTKEKLAFLNNTTIKSRKSFDRNVPCSGTRLNTISEVNSQELNSTGSLLSDFSYSRSEDDLDVSAIKSRKWKALHTESAENMVSPKRRRSSTNRVVEKTVQVNATDTIVATTTVSVPKDGPITATSIIEAVPQDPEPVTVKPSAPPASDIIEQMWLKDKSNNPIKGRSSVKRQHSFVPKTVIRPDTCGPCNKRIRFGKIVLKCKDCRGICHTECKDELPLPCIPQVNTPTQKGAIGTIADYAPTVPPMVPALIVHCVNEIELRGLNEVGIYRVPGSEKEVRMLKEKFLRCKAPPILNEIDIHVICGVVKDFLRSLQESLVTNALWNDFIQAVDGKDIREVAPCLYRAISDLPQPNRDTLAYIMLHLIKVSESPDCKMPVGNLSKVFGPTIVGYSSQDPDPHTMLNETRLQALVMEHLMRIPPDFWSTYVDMDSKVTTPRNNKILLQTPSTVSLSKTSSRNFFTPHGPKSVQTTRKKRKFFPTPPRK